MVAPQVKSGMLTVCRLLIVQFATRARNGHFIAIVNVLARGTQHFKEPNTALLGAEDAGTRNGVTNNNNYSHLTQRMQYLWSTNV
jgi:hypothetical protein